MSSHKPKRGEDNNGISCGNLFIRILAGLLALVLASFALWILSIGGAEATQFVVVMGFLAFVCAYVAVNPSKKQMRFDSMPSNQDQSSYTNDKSTSFSYEVSRLVRVLVVGASNFIFFMSGIGLIIWTIPTMIQNPNPQIFEFFIINLVVVVISGIIRFTVKFKPPSDNIRDELSNRKRKNEDKD